MARESLPASSTTAAVPPAHPPRRFRFRSFKGGVAVGIALVLGLQQLVHRTLLVDFLLTPLAVTDTAGRGDVIVVPGAGVNADCSPNLFAIRRTMLSKRLFTEGRAPLILFSGGRGAETPCPVASVMADLARQLGVPAERIVTETEAKSTVGQRPLQRCAAAEAGRPAHRARHRFPAHAAGGSDVQRPWLPGRAGLCSFAGLAPGQHVGAVPRDPRTPGMRLVLGPGPLRRSCGRAIPTRLRTALPRVRSNALSYSCFRSPRHPRRLVPRDSGPSRFPAGASSTRASPGRCRLKSASGSNTMSSRSGLGP